MNDLRRTALRTAKRWVKDLLLDGMYPSVYRRATARKPVDPRKVIFLNSKGSEFPDSFKLMRECIERKGAHDCLYIALAQNEVRFREYVSNCLRFVREAADASVIFLEDASDVVSCLPLRPETKAVQLWHACGAFKKFGMSTADKIFGGSREEKKRHPFYENLSLVTVSSPEVIWAYAEAMDLEDRPGVIRALGVPRTDVFFDNSFLRASRKAIAENHPSIGQRGILLYAPTFRGRVSEAAAPDRLDILAMREALGDKWFLLIKHHPFVKELPAIPAECADFAEYAAEGESIDQLMAASRMCISDYSSLVFEYSLLGRPMMFFAYDKEEYDDWRGFYYDYEDFTPGPVFKTTAELIDFIPRASVRFDRKKAIAFRNRFMCSCDGRATERIYRVVFG